MTPPHYVLTGGPCAGKTTLIFELEKRGYSVLPEAARLVIDKGLAAGKTLREIRSDPDWRPSVVRRKLAMEREVPPGETYFFDRGVPDSVAYYRAAGFPIDGELQEALGEVAYRKIFLLDLIDFVPDEARNESPEEAERLHGLIEAAYRELGYEIERVPVLPVPGRADFLLARL